MLRKICSTLILVACSVYGFATEGMWIPSLINMFHSDMQTYGLKLSAEEVYSINKASLKDAIVQFDGGCTAELVSDQGLILTNHHCGFGAIQSHSSLEHDYLKNGFWAKNKSEELANPEMHVTFVKEIRDVTAGVNKGITKGMSEKDRQRIKRSNIQSLQAENRDGEFVQAYIKPFNKGNQYYMLITVDYYDIRLVGTPPSAIGKYGGDTDNWVWPRHTGDFSVFRIYADKDNRPAKYSKDNKPFTPKHYLPINLKSKGEGDFTMVYGFPGSTDQHYPSSKLGFYMEKERPARIKMRQATIDILAPAMNNSDEIRIKYASKQARIANAWKKWIGQLGGLKEMRALDVKTKWEKEYIAKAKTKPEWKEYAEIIGRLDTHQEGYKDYEFARALFIEYFYVGPEFLKFSSAFTSLIEDYEKLSETDSAQNLANSLIGRVEAFYKDYDKGVDQQIYNKLSPLYVEYNKKELLPENFDKNWSNLGDKIFNKSLFLQKDKLIKTLKSISKSGIKKMKKDPAFVLAQSLRAKYFDAVSLRYQNYRINEEKLLQKYVEGIMVMFPNKKLWADANSTMRITYGKIEGSAPRDGMQYTHYTTIDGIMQKYDPENPDFELTDRFLELYKKKDFGQYTQDGELWVCFTASNHTTGGNSGSPVIDANGHLIGINFDRSWESTMSDFMFSEKRCRNIAVDIRYVLWVIDKYGEASHLIDEMKIIR